MYVLEIFVCILFVWRVLVKLDETRKEQEKVKMKLSEMIAQLVVVTDSLERAKNEIIDKIDDLEESLVDVDIPANAEALLLELKNKAQELDDIVPDKLPG